MQKLFRVISPQLSASLSPPKLSAARAQSDLPNVEHEGLEAQAIAADDLLVVSPYTSRAHLLDLNLLNHAQILLAKALTILSPSTHAYATSSYINSFNWDAVFRLLAAKVKADGFAWREQFFYVIIFRSQVPASTDRGDLAALDVKAHAEAMASIWRRREDAQPGSSGEGHKAAMRATINLYTEWQVERLKLVVGDNAETWDFLPWTD
ncbi:MAG: hypothetical protein Q9186_006458 [Xanthomendoza sp. 1 TL-2023]